MARKRLTKKIGFRMEDEEFRLAQRLAAGKDLSPGDWCRQVVREKLTTICAQASHTPSGSMAMTPADVVGNQKQGIHRLSDGEVILFLESGRLRWLLQEFLDYLSRDELTPKVGRFLVDQTNRVNGPATEFAKKWMAIYDGLDRKPTN